MLWLANKSHIQSSCWIIIVARIEKQHPTQFAKKVLHLHCLQNESIPKTSAHTPRAQTHAIGFFWYSYLSPLCITPRWIDPFLSHNSLVHKVATLDLLTIAYRPTAPVHRPATSFGLLMQGATKKEDPATLIIWVSITHLSTCDPPDIYSNK